MSVHSTCRREVSREGVQQLPQAQRMLLDPAPGAHARHAAFVHAHVDGKADAAGSMALKGVAQQCGVIHRGAADDRPGHAVLQRIVDQRARAKSAAQLDVQSFPLTPAPGSIAGCPACHRALHPGPPGAASSRRHLHSCPAIRADRLHSASRRRTRPSAGARIDRRAGRWRESAARVTPSARGNWRAGANRQLADRSGWNCTPRKFPFRTTAVNDCP